MSKKTTSSTVSDEQVSSLVLQLRGHKVMLDADLAVLYQVETSNLNKAVKRNIERFPEDFMFQLTKQEAECLRFQIGILNIDKDNHPVTGLRFQSGTLKAGRGQHRKYLPYAFTEQGIAMLSSVLRSDRAVQVNIAMCFNPARREATAQDPVLTPAASHRMVYRLSAG